MDVGHDEKEVSVGQGEMTACPVQVSHSVSQSRASAAGARTSVRSKVSVKVSVNVGWDNPDSLPLLVYCFPWWIPNGREGDKPPIENVTSARPKTKQVVGWASFPWALQPADLQHA